jgi:hypothetical protein
VVQERGGVFRERKKERKKGALPEEDKEALPAPTAKNVSTATRNPILGILGA